MPLLDGLDPEIIKKNVETEHNLGKPIKQAVAIALNHARTYKENFKKILKRGGETFMIKGSKRKNKKYDVYIKTDGEYKYLLSYGDNRYEQYKDALGLYKHLDHNDKKRRELYYKRHGDTDNMYSSKWFSHRFLW
jgi:hypothetical protein